LRSKDAPRLSDAGPIRTTPVLSSLERMNKVIGPCSQAVNSWTTTSLKRFSHMEEASLLSAMESATIVLLTRK
jgi:pyruvate/2-oxoacid:ferredoxin oxidoreductase alpha subunit